MNHFGFWIADFRLGTALESKIQNQESKIA